jgi:hypothetical protein
MYVVTGYSNKAFNYANKNFPQTGNTTIMLHKLCFIFYD